uniref:Bone marrow proteoglycan-like n=1 Tax=Coturnix japonica TaxID=93934 RepID=A0A8C2YF66_COTJA
MGWPVGVGEPRTVWPLAQGHFPSLQSWCPQQPIAVVGPRCHHPLGQPCDSVSVSCHALSPQGDAPNILQALLYLGMHSGTLLSPVSGYWCWRGCRGDTLQPVPSLSPVAHHEGTCRQRGGQREALCSGEDMAHLQQCPGERGGEVSGMPGSHGHCQCQALTCAPQSYCRNTYRGQLASVHSTSTNEVLRKLNGSWKTCWEDQSPWNYANWATGQPQRLFKTCTVLSPKDGLWRSKACFKIRPFICEY